MAQDTRRLRSEYLKNGCKECKRRKIKCDEFRPPPPDAIRVINAQGRELCWQCTRLKKECEYPLKGERVARVLLKVLKEEQQRDEMRQRQGSGAISGGNLGATSGGVRIPNSLGSSQYGASGAPPGAAAHPISTSPRGSGPASSGLSGAFLRYNENDHGPNPEYQAHPLPYGQGPPLAMYMGTLPSGLQPGHLSALDIASGPQHFDHSDLTGLATDLNNLVSDMMFEANPDSKNVLDSDSNHTPLTPASEEMSFVETSKSHISLNDWIPRNVGLGYLDVRSLEEHMFLQNFYQKFANIILPFNPFDRPLQAYFNPVRDILLKCASKEPFLLAAIMAQGVRSSLAKVASAEDEEAYYQYLLRCLKLLGPALGHASSKNGLALTSNIEAVLLTVLLLASSNAANAKQNWRPHLKGAKDLLLKHTTQGPHVRNSKVLIFCKFWFMSIEILAGLSLTLGGTVNLEAELDLLLNCLDLYELQMLTDLGLVLPNGFSLLGGYHCELIHPLRDLIKLLNKVRHDKYYIRLETSEYVRLLSEFYRQLGVIFVNKKAIFDLDELPGKIIPDGHLLEAVTVDSKPLVISWMDTSQQLYSLAAIITLLTEFLRLPHSSPQVQNLTCLFTSILTFIMRRENSPLFIKYSPLMIQWPLLVAGLNCIRDQDQFAVTELFNSCTTLGAGSAGHSMNRLRRVWRKHQAGVMDDSGDESPVDVVNY